jgi:hypothetical protein
MTNEAFPRRAGLIVSTICLGLAHSPAWSAASCTAQSAAHVSPVVELYTSEGCNSCPPADRWVSRLKADPGVVALAFHVDYWDRLGWKDRFASPAYTQRQAQQQPSNGARFSYTPQIVVDGIDRPQWPSLPLPSSSGQRDVSKVDIVMTREGSHVNAVVRARPGAPAQLAAFWAVTEQDHRTAVKAGENEGVTLQHDFVVRQYVQVPAWSSAAQPPVELRFDANLAPAGANPTSINLVVLDAATRRPVQALKLGC